jgi:hypothetical protein
LIVLEEIGETTAVGVVVVIDEAALEAKEEVESVRARAELLGIPEVPFAD